jgi:hypothetical protein
MIERGQLRNSFLFYPITPKEKDYNTKVPLHYTISYYLDSTFH